MPSSSEPISSATVLAAYARRKPATERTWRRWWFVAAGVIFLGALALILRSSLTSWVNELLGRGGAAIAYHVVEPVTMSVTLTEDGELKPRESVEIKCEVEGQNTILRVVDESTKVKKGDLLVELASEQLVERLDSEQIELNRLEADLQAAIEELDIQRNQNDSEIKKAEIDLQVAELDLRKYREGDYPQKLTSVELDIKQTEMDIKRKSDELEKNRRLEKKGFVTPMRIEQLEFELEKARMTMQRHELSKEILLKYDQPRDEMQKTSARDQAREELERVRARADSRLKQSQARVEQHRSTLAMRQRRFDRLKTQVEKCKIYAPTDGVVQYRQDNWRWGSERIAAGQKAYEGQTLLVLPDTSQMLVSTRIHEADRHLVKEELPCTVTVPAVPGEAFTGKITKIDKFADSENRWLNPDLKEHSTEILLDATDAALSPGDSAEVKILIEMLEDVLAVPVQCVFTRGSRSFVFLKDEEPVEVTLGRSNATMVEVVDGLSKGDRVLMRADERLQAKLPTIGTAEADSVEPAEAKFGAGGERGPGRGPRAKAPRTKTVKPAVKEEGAKPDAAAGGGRTAGKSGS
jgi:HlyD family secretion protein